MSAHRGTTYHGMATIGLFIATSREVTLIMFKSEERIAVANAPRLEDALISLGHHLMAALAG